MIISGRFSISKIIQNNSYFDFMICLKAIIRAQ